ncbi:MAG TPA: CAP domain-containing protein [Thermoanaerobaculia bacterium]|jgi:uncharacterized protein YkwD
MDDSRLDPLRRDFLAEINRLRADAGRAPVALSAELTRAAQARADEIAAAGSLDSVGVVGENILARARQHGYNGVSLSQVVAQGDGDPGALIAEWRHQSDAIVKDLEHENHRDLGVGVAWLDSMPLYVLYLGVTAPDDFARDTQKLRDPARVRRELFEAVNREREAHGLAPLRESPQLERAAQGHADDMLARGYYGHASPEHTMVLGRARDAGYVPDTVGENIARGQRSVAEVMQGWMASPEHRKNILNPTFTQAGYGMALGRTPGGVDEVLWVQVFGRPRPGAR